MLTAANIDFQQLQVVKMFKINKVFLVKQGNDYAVLKGESMVMTGRKHGMRAGIRNLRIDTNWGGDTPQVKKSIRTASEIIAYVTGDTGGISTLTSDQQTAWANKLLHTPNISYNGGTHNVQDDDIRMLDDMTVWSVMEAYQQLENFEDMGLKQNGPIIQSQLSRSLVTLINRDPKMFNTLGRIVILDFFLGNSDRFSYNPQRNPAGDVVNMGNIFLTWDNVREIRFIATDFFSVESGCSYLGVHWNKTIAQGADEGFSSHADAVRHFNLLRNGKTGERDRMGRAIIDALDRETIPSLVINSSVKKAFRKGLHEGRALLKQYYKQRVNYLNWPRGLESRFRALGW